MSNPLDEPESPSPTSSTPIPKITDDLATTTQASADQSATSSSPETPHQPLAIEDAQPTSQGQQEAEQEEEIHTLDLGEGNVVKLDKLGPMIINSDGTLSRIQNWQDLHPIEQERTVRLLVKKRNLVRLQKLDKENKAEDDGERLTALKEGQKD